MSNSFDSIYKNAIDEIAQDKSTLTFNNSGPFHASVVISNIYKHADEIIRIYANDLNGEISDVGDYIAEMERYVEEGKVLKVVLDEKPNEDSEAFKYLIGKSKERDTVQLRIASELFKYEVSKAFNSDTHFTVGDARMFRIEYNNTNHKAYCGFNNQKYPSKLIEIFDRNFDNCAKVK